MLDTDTGEVVERRLENENEEARTFYTALVGPVRVGIEATGATQWFEAMLAELGHANLRLSAGAFLCSCTYEESQRVPSSVKRGTTSLSARSI